MNERTKIAAATRAVRALRGWTQPDLAKRVGTTTETLRAIERGRTPQADSYTHRICRSSGITIEQFVGLMDLYSKANERLPDSEES